LGRGNKDFDIMFATQSACSFGKHAKFREFTIRRVKVEIGDAFRRDAFVTKLLFAIY